MATNPLNIDQVRQAKQKLSPTLIIGLGGSGGDILLRIRKKFFEKFGGIEEFPIVGYLWFDTDKGYKDVGAKQFARKVDFSATEERLVTIADTASITGNLDKDVFRNIAAWWPSGLNVISKLDEGAGQYRPYSRLGIFHHYASTEVAVCDSIEQALNKIQHPGSRAKVENSPKLQRLNYAAEMDLTRRNVYVIGSLAGGTGSGMFIDIARIVRNLAPDADLVGFFMTSRFFPMATQRMHANTYAALLEWDYYNTHKFKPNWTNEPWPEIPPPLFDYSYVLDTPNSAHLALGSQPDDHKKLYETVAENVFKDFSHGSFAQAKRSARVNVKQFIGVPAYYPPMPKGSAIVSEQDERIFRQKFNRHFQAYGLASISVPHDRIITACAHKLAADLVLYWKGQGATDTNVASITAEVAKFMPSENVLIDGDSLLARLDDSAGTADKSSAAGSFLNRMIRFYESTLDQSRAMAALQRPDFLEGEINNYRTEQLVPAAPGENAGLMLRTIAQNADKIVAAAIKVIEQKCSERIDTQNLSVYSTIMFAERVCEVLEQQGKACAERLTGIRSRIEDLESDYNTLLNQYRIHVARHNLDFRKQIILDYDELRWRESIIGAGVSPDEKELQPGLLLALRQKALLEKAREVCDLIVARVRGRKNEKGEFRGGIISRFRELDRTFEDVASTLRADSAYFEDKYNEDLSLVLFEARDVDEKYYWKYAKASKVMAVSDDARDKLHLTAASIKDSDFLKQEGGSARIIDLCRKVFEPIRKDFHVVDVLFDHFGCSSIQDGKHVLNDHLQAELKRIFDSSRYWGEGGTDPIRNYVPQQDQIEFLVGLPEVPIGREIEEADRSRIRGRRDAIKNYLSSSIPANFKFHDVPETSEIIFYTELSGVPLTYYSSMYALRSAYRQAQTTDPALHLESKEASKFEDVLILTTEETERFQVAWQCLVQGAMFNEIWVTSGAPRPEFGYTEMIHGVETRPRMGDERATIGYLQIRTDLAQKLLERTEDLIDSIITDLNGSDTVKAENARRLLLGMSALAVLRMEELARSAEQQNWHRLPMYSKMEYLALSELNERVHAVAGWPTFASELLEAKRNVDGFATKRLDGRYALKLQGARKPS